MRLKDFMTHGLPSGSSRTKICVPLSKPNRVWRVTVMFL